jgi:peptidoglycan/LPS O-acetylase OafA/YrhL
VAKGAEYQPHVDGLRALAILSILLFHAHIPGFSGGFVGVDIFFVVSGYLITRIIAREIDAGSFSLAHFYERRARRIVPALTVTVLAVLGAAALLYLPGDFGSVPLSALATALFAANFYFFSEVGYFQTGADTKPLLHTWSLGIEEQFYLGFPLLLLLVARWIPQRRLWVVAAAVLASFALAVATQGDRSGFAFYLLPPRAWELLVGALLALGLIPPVTAKAARETISIVALLGIAFAVFVYDSATTFPGVTALAPVLGAAALIHCAPGNRVGALLASKPMIGIGLISYSLYLWHWPVIVFAVYALDRRLAGWLSVAAVLGSFLLAILSWRFVEQPFRNPRALGRNTLFVGSAVALGGVATLSAGMLALGGWPGRFSPEVARMASARYDFSPERARCHDSASRSVPACVLGAPGVAPTAVVWGDSHGVEFAYALSRGAAMQHRALLQRTQSSCPPVLGYASAETPHCARINRALFDAVLADKRLRTIYLVAFWASPAYADTRPGLDALIGALIADGRQVVVIGPVPPNRFDVPRRLERLAQAGRLGEATGASRVDFAEAESRLAAVARRWQGSAFRYLKPAAMLCDQERCDILIKGKPLYFDHHHLSGTGAALLLEHFARTQKLPF